MPVLSFEIDGENGGAFHSGTTGLLVCKHSLRKTRLCIFGGTSDALGWPNMFLWSAYPTPSKQPQQQARPPSKASVVNQ